MSVHYDTRHALSPQSRATSSPSNRHSKNIGATSLRRYRCLLRHWHTGSSQPAQDVAHAAHNNLIRLDDNTLVDIGMTQEMLDSLTADAIREFMSEPRTLSGPEQCHGLASRRLGGGAAFLYIVRSSHCNRKNSSQCVAKVGLTGL